MAGSLSFEHRSSPGYRRLAARVIAQALHDLQSSSPEDQRSAKTFLSGSEMLYFWCDLAEIRTAHVVARAATFESHPVVAKRAASPPLVTTVVAAPQS